MKSYKNQCCICGKAVDVIRSWKSKAYCTKHWDKQCDKEESQWEKAKIEPQKTLKVYNKIL